MSLECRLFHDADFIRTELAGSAWLQIVLSQSVDHRWFSDRGVPCN